MAGQTGETEKFAVTSGRWTGIMIQVVVVVVVAICVLDRENGFGLTTAAVAVLVGVLSWATMLRPRVWLEPERLVLRNAFETVAVPLAGISEVAVRQVLAVRVGEKRFVSPAIGKSWRQTLRSRAKDPFEASASSAAGSAAVGPGAADFEGAHYADFVESRIRERARQEAERQGVRRYSAEQDALADDVERGPAVVELVLLVLSALAVLLGFLL